MNKQASRHVMVAAGLIEDGNNVLVAQRMPHDRYGLLWEFPGGKIEAGETAGQALARELMEELGVSVQVGELVTVYEDEIPELKITVHLLRCRIVAGEPQCRECHALRWVTGAQLEQLALAPADRKAAAWLRARGL